MQEPAVNVVCLIRGGHHWVFLFDDANRGATLQAATKMAADPRLAFDWRDASEVSAKIRGLR